MLRDNPNDSDESYDSEEMLERGAANGVMAIRDSSGLIH